MFKKIGLGLMVLIAALLIIIAIQPSDFKVSRSATMKAPLAKVFDEIDDFQSFQTWSPWAKLDPNCKYTFEGPESGAGSIMKWAGDNEVGEGSLTMTETDPASGVKQKLEFTKPFVCQNDVAISLRPEGDNQTVVVWSMSGKNDFMGKAMSLIMNMDKMVGSMYDKGLATLKAKVEKSE
jgi:Polyketide cyclase / dehydrase and lipid transport